MAVTKRITIKSTVKSAVDYIIDRGKTHSLAEAGSEKALTYIADDAKTEHGDLVYGYLCHPDSAADEFEIVKRQNMLNVGKEPEDDGGVLAHHFIISFRSDDPITPDGALEYGKEIVEEMFKYHQAVIAVHTNTDNLHIHIIMNAHTTDPVKQYGRLTRMKYGSDRNSYQEFRDVSDRMCIEKGLSVEIPEYDGKNTSWYEHNDQKSGSTLFKNIIKDKIKEAVEDSTNWEEYKIKIKELGVEISERGSTISYRVDHEQMKRPMREKRLGGQYTKEALVKYMETPPEIEEEKWHYRKDFPKYRIRSVSMTGRPKGILELIIQLAQVILEDKSKNKEIDGLERWKINQEVQAMADSLTLRKELGINNEKELKDNLVFLGTKLNNYRLEAQKIESSIEKNKESFYLILKLSKKEELSLSDEEVSEIKTKLKDKLSLESEDDIKVWEKKFNDKEDRLEVVQSAIKEVSSEYGKVARLRESIEKAKDSRFLNREAFRDKEQEREEKSK